MSSGVTFYGSIAMKSSALKRSGSIEGGASVTFDIPERYLNAFKMLCDAVGKPLRVTVEVLSESSYEEALDE